MRLVRGVTVLFIAVMLGTSAWGQTGTSTIRGTVTDPQGRVVPGATVTLTNTATNAVRTAKTSDAGTYTFDLITPADYRVEVDAKGFKKKVVGSVKALIGKPTDTDVALDVGASTEIVEVQASAQEAVINTQDATLGNNFESIQITELPLEARNIVDLLTLQPGSTREGYVTGARADQSNITLDGVDINNAQTGNAEIPRSTNGLIIGGLDNDAGDITTGPALRLNSEALEEFRVTTANGNANQGRSSGSQVNLITKSGTNKWHGAGSEFYRSRGFTANDWFNNHADPIVPRTPLVRNTFGGNFGGPVIKDKAFFFYAYEGRHDASGTSVVRTVPLANLGQGTINYQYCADSSCSSVQESSLTVTPANPGPFGGTDGAGINQAALDALAAAAAKYPANDATTGDQLNTGGFRFNAPTPTRLNSHVAKFDLNLTSRQTAFARLNIQYDHQQLPQWLPDTPSPAVWSHPWGLAIGHTWTIGNNLVNNLRYGFTRQAFTEGGDSTGNDTDFRFVFQPNGETHPLSRVTPVHNITDDLSWVKGNHNLQFGVNIRKINNQRVSYGTAFDFAETNPSFYLNTGANIPGDFQAYLDANGLPGDENQGQSLASTIEVRNAGTAAIGRFTEITANFTFDKNGNLLAAGTPTSRNFATQAYDGYVQDTWKVRPSLTLTMGLRYSLERPVYEAQGYEVQPGISDGSGCTITSLSTYFQSRLSAANQGSNYTTPICVTKSGPANGGAPMYHWDKNNFQPRFAAAWSPEGGSGFFGRLFGNKLSVLRGGFALTNDYYGQALAVDWDLNNTLGFTSNFTNHANTFDSTTANGKPLGPLFTGFGQDVRSLIGTAGGTVPGSLQFPLQATSLNGDTEFGERIESSLDAGLHAPTEYVWNFTFERTLPKGGVFSASYIGRMGRGLLAHRDVAAFNDVRDPQTGIDWYTAATALEKIRQQGTDISQVPSLIDPKVAQYFNNVFPAGMASIIGDYDGLTYDPTWTNAQAYYGEYQLNDFFEANDWTDVQAEADLALAYNGENPRFMQPQYGTLSSWSTIGNSNYHALAVSYRQRLSSLILDFNYTWSHTLDDASGLQAEFGIGGNFQGNGSFIVNPIRQHDNYASSDFDVRHNINADVVWQLPFGKGHTLLGNANKATDAIVGGWQLSSIFRWNTGLPATSPYDDGRWATNWDFQANVTPLKPIHSCPNKPVNGTPNLFGNCNITQIYQNFRNAYPGETGPRNYLRYPGYIDVDLGLAKSWKMPYSENHLLQLRWDVFNVTNTQHLTSFANGGVAADPGLLGLTPPSDFYNFTQIQGKPRVMQLGVRYSF
jgi:hypothetical protein